MTYNAYVTAVTNKLTLCFVSQGIVRTAVRRGGQFCRCSLANLLQYLYAKIYRYIMWFDKVIAIITRGQSNLTKSASQGAHSPVRGHPRGSKFVPLNSWGRVSY